MENVTQYGFGTTVALPFEEAVERTKAALAREGFGVLTEIDVKATLKKKLDVDFRPYVIFGACNPPLAHRALSTDIEIGLLLPCNVIVYAGDDENESVVSVMDPEAALSIAGRDDIAPIAREVSERMHRVVDSLRAV